MPLVTFCLRHFSADFIIFTCEFEFRQAQEYFDNIQDVKVTKDMLDLAKHIVNQKAGRFEPSKF